MLLSFELQKFLDKHILLMLLETSLTKQIILYSFSLINLLQKNILKCLTNLNTKAYDQQEFETLKSDGFLLPRPPKLAPIASFETLSESIDLQLDDLGEFDVKGETKAKDDLVRYQLCTL